MIVLSSIKCRDVLVIVNILILFVNYLLSTNNNNNKIIIKSRRRSHEGC